MSGPASALTPRPSARAVLQLGLAAGLATGLLEALVLLVRHKAAGELIHVGAQYMWMAPLGDLVLFAVPAILLSVLVQLAPGIFSFRVTSFLLGWAGFTCVLLMFPALHRVAALALAAGIAWQLSRLWTRTDSLQRRASRVLVILAALVALIAAGSLGWQTLRERRALSELPHGSGPRPNILLIILDTVRAKELSLYGYGRDTSPFLSRLAARGVRFDRAFSTASWTLPSHASLLTGRYPHEVSADWLTPLDLNYPTLAEKLGTLGYASAGFVANVGYLSWEFGLDRGFQHYEDFLYRPQDFLAATSLGRQLDHSLLVRDLLKTDQHLVRIDAQSVSHRFLDWLDGHRDRPFFAFLNYYDAHGPYLPPPPWESKFGPARASDVDPVHRYLTAPSKEPLDSATVRTAIEQYDGAIAYLDDQLGRLFAELDSRHLLDSTVVLLTADHGEEFGEHGVYDHGNSLYRPSVQVPLLVVYPSAAPAQTVVADPVSLRDVAATLGGFAGLPSGSFPGASLARFWQGQSPAEADSQSPVISEVSKGIRTPPWYPVSQGDMRSLVGSARRYILGGDGAEELFDLTDDWERTPLPVTDSLAAPFRRELARWPRQ